MSCLKAAVKNTLSWGGHEGMFLFLFLFFLRGSIIKGSGYDAKIGDPEAENTS